MNTTYCPTRLSGIVATALLAILGLSVSSYAQQCGGGKISKVTPSGTEFLLVFMENEDPNYLPAPDPATYQKMYIASLGDTATVHITCRGNSYNKTIFLNKYQGTTIWLDSLVQYQFLVESDETVSDFVVHVTSTSDIVCYGMNHKSLTADAFIALPKNVAGSAYMVMAYRNAQPLSGANHPSEFAVAAFEDGTTIQITTTVRTASNPAGTSTYQLNAGQCVQVQADVASDLLDLTGSIVTSDKPIAVFGGHQRAEVPWDYTFIQNGGVTTSRDHLAEQIPPVSTWGKAFLARNFLAGGRTTGDLMRLLSSDDNNTVTIDGRPWGKPFSKGEYRDTLLGYSGGIDTEFAIQSSQPSLVGMFAHTANVSNTFGDPFFAIVPPVDQSYFDYTFFISDDATYAGNNSLIVATERSGVGKISLDGANLTAQFIPAKVPLTSSLGQKSYSVAVVPQMAPGIHRIQSPNPAENGFSILAYGFGLWDSYGYTAGSLFKPIHGIWHVPSPVGLPAPGKPSEPSFTVRNILGNESVWLDSVRIAYSSNPEHITVKTRNARMNSLGVLNVGGEKPITLSPATTPNVAITGTATIFYHSGLWFDMLPLEIPFTVEAGTTASVNPADEPLAATVLYPNPAHGDATLDFTTPSAAHTTIRIFDALGRVVATVADQLMTEGRHSDRIPARSLSNGIYFYELSAPELGIDKRAEFLVVH